MKSIDSSIPFFRFQHIVLPYIARYSEVRKGMSNEEVTIT